MVWKMVQSDFLVGFRTDVIQFMGNEHPTAYTDFGLTWAWITQPDGNRTERTLPNG